MEVPLVFGGDAVIHCMYHNNLSCTDQVFWTWTTEPNNDIIMTNGTLSEKYKNGKKYSERRSSCTQYSNLVISNFSEIDYRKKYKCGIANINSPESSFVEYSKEEITFEKISYECKFITWYKVSWIESDIRNTHYLHVTQGTFSVVNMKQ